MDNSPLAFNLLANEQVTAAVRQFQASGSNPYRGDAAAISDGEDLYEKWCQACHLPDGTGRIGPSLVDEEHRYPRVSTDVGMFEVIYAGATGAMQAFGDRVSRDEILKIMAFVETLGER